MHRVDDEEGMANHVRTGFFLPSSKFLCLGQPGVGILDWEMDEAGVTCICSSPPMSPQVPAGAHQAPVL